MRPLKANEITENGFVVVDPKKIPGDSNWVFVNGVNGVKGGNKSKKLKSKKLKSKKLKSKKLKKNNHFY